MEPALSLPKGEGDWTTDGSAALRSLWMLSSAAGFTVSCSAFCAKFRLHLKQRLCDHTPAGGRLGSAGIIGDMIPFIGPVVMVIILIGGHIFNLALNALGSFIHSGRLQFVEFFGKFMEGGGTQFKPFKKEHKYISIVDEV